MQWTRSTLANASGSASLIKAQATVYAVFASGSLTVAMLNLAALTLLWSARFLLKTAWKRPACPCP